MTVYQRRRRTVSFRMSDEEYKSLQKISEARGARSLSDYARSATFRLMATDARTIDAPVLDRVQILLRWIDDTHRELRQLAQVVGQQ